jgi:hypothetical protein
MSTWDQAELRKITQADDLHIAPFREDGKTYGTPTWIWSVALTANCTCEPTTGEARAGARPPCGKRRDA